MGKEDLIKIFGKCNLNMVRYSPPNLAWSNQAIYVKNDPNLRELVEVDKILPYQAYAAEFINGELRLFKDFNIPGESSKKWEKLFKVLDKTASSSRGIRLAHLERESELETKLESLLIYGAEVYPMISRKEGVVFVSKEYSDYIFKLSHFRDYTDWKVDLVRPPIPEVPLVRYRSNTLKDVAALVVPRACFSAAKVVCIGSFGQNFDWT